MTTSNLSEHQQQIISDAIWKFFSAFLQRGVSRNSSVLTIMASILYLLKKGCISKQENVSDITSSQILSIIKLDYLATLNSKLLDEWKQKGIKNQALIVTIPENDSMASFIRANLELMKRIGHTPTYLFDFVETISNNVDGDLFYLKVLDLAISISSSNPFVRLYSQPDEFGRLASALLDVKGKTVFNPFSGVMSFATTLTDYAFFSGIELDSQTWEISQFRMCFAGLKHNTDCKHGDVSDWTNQKYDVIVSTPPLGQNLSVKGEDKPINAEWLCLKKFEETTTENGVLFTYVSPHILFESSRYRAIRRLLTEKNYLDAVISLPGNLMRPYTSISMVGLLLRKDRDMNAPIKMIDASSLIKGDKKQPILDVDAVLNCYNTMSSDNCVFVSMKTIVVNDFIWTVSKYLKAKSESFPEGYEVIELGAIIEPIRGESLFNDKKGHVARISSLSTNGADCTRKVEQFEESDDLSNARKITEPVLLFSTIRELKPTYCEASIDKPLFIHPNVMSFKIKEQWVSPTYLCLELSRRTILSSYYYYPRFKRSDLLKTKIAFPSIDPDRSLEMQNSLYREAADSFKLAKAKELGLQSVIDNMKTEYINTVRMRKHDMMPYMRELGSFSRMMQGYVKKYASDEFQIKMEELLNQFNNAYRGLSALLEVFSQEDKFGNPEHLNLDQFFRKYVSNHDDSLSNYSIEYYCDKSALQAYGIKKHKKKSNADEFEACVEIAKLDLDRLVQNIVVNAQIHGFTDSERKDYHIDINLTIDSESGMFQIDFYNNGNPLPKGLDRIRYGLNGEKAGITGRTGHGGYIVKAIVKNYRGDYDIFMDGQNTVVRILLPISNISE